MEEKFKGNPAAQEAASDLLKNPADADTQAAFRRAIRKSAEEDPAWWSMAAGFLAKD